MSLSWDKATYDSLYSFQGNWVKREPGEPIITLHYHRFMIRPILFDRARNLFRTRIVRGNMRVLVIGSSFNWTVEALRMRGVQAEGTDTSPHILDSQGLSEEEELRTALTKAGVDPDTHHIHLPGGLYQKALDTFLDNQSTRTTREALPEQGDTITSRFAIRNRFSNNEIDLILTEDVLAGMSDEEVLVFAENITNLSNTARIIHMTTRPVFLPTLEDFPNISPENPPPNLDPRGKYGLLDPRLNWHTPTEWKTLLHTEGFTKHEVMSLPTMEVVT